MPPGSNVDGHRGNHFMMPWWRRSAKKSGGLPREAECKKKKRSRCKKKRRSRCKKKRRSEVKNGKTQGQDSHNPNTGSLNPSMKTEYLYRRDARNPDTGKKP